MADQPDSTKFVVLEIKSKPDGPGIEGGSAAYVHVFFQGELSNWKRTVFDFIDYYGYQILTVEETPRVFDESASWSAFNKQQAQESRSTGFPRFGTFNIFD